MDPADPIRPAARRWLLHLPSKSLHSTCLVIVSCKLRGRHLARGLFIIELLGGVLPASLWRGHVIDPSRSSVSALAHNKRIALHAAEVASLGLVEVVLARRTRTQTHSANTQSDAAGATRQCGQTCPAITAPRGRGGIGQERFIFTRRRPAS